MAYISLCKDSVITLARRRRAAGVQAGAGPHPAAIQVRVHQGGHLLHVLAVRAHQHPGGRGHHPQQGLLEHLLGR